MYRTSCDLPSEVLSDEDLIDLAVTFVLTHEDMLYLEMMIVGAKKPFCDLIHLRNAVISVNDNYAERKAEVLAKVATYSVVKSLVKSFRRRIEA